MRLRASTHLTWGLPNNLRLVNMAHASAPSSPPKARDEEVDEHGITRRETRRDRAVDMEKSTEDVPATYSDSSDQEQPKQFEEGGYGW